MLELAQVTKQYGSIPALLGVDLKVGTGEVVGLLGPNGAGKTTLLSIAVGLRRADSGIVRVDGLDPARNSAARALIGYAPQATGVYPSLSVADNLRLYARLSGLRSHRLQARIEETANALNLLGLLHRKAESLSGGERRRVHVAGAVVARPPLVILDEATAGIDVDARRTLIQFVHALANDGTAVLFSTHYLHEVDDSSVRIVILDHGRTIAEGNVSDLLRKFGHSAIELSFYGPAPALALPFPSEQHDNVLRVTDNDPSAALAVILPALGSEAQRLSGIEILRPSLDGVFAKLTGHPFEAPAGTDDPRLAEPERRVNVVPT
jgi:ABC-2 type transport system ATP-binding protein